MKNKVILYISIVLTFISAVYWMVQVAYLNGAEISNQEGNLRELKKKVEVAISKQKNDTELRERYGVLINEFRALRNIVPSLESFADVQAFIRETATDNNVQIIWQQPFLEDTLPTIKENLVMDQAHIERYTVQVQVRGDFVSIGKFMDDLISGEQLINVNKVSIKSDFQKRQGIQNRLNCDITLFTYIYSNDVKGIT